MERKTFHLEWIRVARVCRRWREAALNHPRLWSHVNCTELTVAGMVGILVRAKMAPLHLEADLGRWSFARINAFGRLLEAHLSHTRHLSIGGHCHFGSEFAPLSSPAPTLESLTLSTYPGDPRPAPIPDNLNCTSPNLTSLQLTDYHISWKSPLIRGLRNLQIRLGYSLEARPELEDWLDALNEMPQLKLLSLQSATPVAPQGDPRISRTITLPSLTHFHINEYHARDCAFALAHLVLPTLTRLSISDLARRKVKTCD
jgi:hypothetical protein